MTEQEVLDLINLWIVANGNNEITADVLRPILEEMVKQPNDLIGNLSTLNTTDQSNLVSAINEIYGLINNNSGIHLHEGLDDPNDTPPTTYNIADFYIQKDIFNNPIQIWQYTVGSWIEVTNAYDLTLEQVRSNDDTVLGRIKGDDLFTSKTSNDFAQIGDVDTAVSNKAPKANPTFTGSVVVPNATEPTEAVNLGQLKSVVKSISITDIISHTGTTAKTKVGEVVIPAGFISDNEIWEFEYCVTRDNTGASGTVGFSAYIEGAEAPSVGFIRGLILPAGNLYRTRYVRSMFFKNGKVRRYNNSGSSGNDYASLQNNLITDFNIAVENKIIISFALSNASDTANLEYVIFKKIN